MLVILSVGLQTAVAAVQCPAEVERMLKAREPMLTDQVLEFYNSWSAKEFKAGKKPGTGFTVCCGIGGIGNDPATFGFFGLVRRLQALGCKVVYTVGTGGAESPENAAMVENFVAQKPDAIIFQFSNSQVLGPGLAKAAERGIPVFGFDNWLSGPTVVGEVTSDSFAMGHLAARYVIDKLRGEGEVVHVFSPGHRGIEIRTAMWDLMRKQYPGIKEVARLPYDKVNRIASVRDRMEATLIANPKKGSIDAVLACGDMQAIGAADAIKAAGREDEIFVVGFDGTREALRRIAQGGCFKATVTQDFVLMAAALGHMVVDYLNGKPTPRYLFVPNKLATQENAAQLYKEMYGEELKL